MHSSKRLFSSFGLVLFTLQSELLIVYLSHDMMKSLPLQTICVFQQYLQTYGYMDAVSEDGDDEGFSEFYTDRRTAALK